MYRVIKVNGVQYKYVIGKTHTKINGIGVFRNEEIGKLVEVHTYCECCGESMSSLYSWYKNDRKVSVTPSDIVKRIKAHSPTEQDTFNALVGA